MLLKESRSELVLSFECQDEDRLLFNGFQSWTQTAEVTPSQEIRPLDPFLSFIARPWGPSRYGDSHITDDTADSGKAGCFHGFTYMYRRRGDLFTLIASTDETNGYTIFYYDRLRAELRIVKDAGFGPEVDKGLHLICLEGTEDEVFDAWFEASGISCRPSRPLAGYSSWYNRFDRITDSSITDDLEGCSSVLGPGDLFQIDDGWQLRTGDWEADPIKFPRGMKASADDIHSKGFLAGLWLAPYAAAARSELVRQHPDWLLRHDGKPCYSGCNWGGFYSLDIDNSEVRAFLRELFHRIFSEWGYDLVKLDFLYAAAPWHTEKGDHWGESRGARMCRAMDMLREWCGDGLILGCGVPLAPAFGKVDYCRIGCDAGLDWANSAPMRSISREIVSTANAIGDIYYRRQLNGRAFINDPDVFFLRSDNIKLTEYQKDVHARFCAQYGGMLLTSDSMGEYDEDRKVKYREYHSIWENKDLSSADLLDEFRRAAASRRSGSRNGAEVK